MTIKTDVLISILKLTNSGPAAEEAVAMDANVPVHVINNVLEGLREIGLIECENGKIEVSSNQRVKLAIHAINHGTDIERVCKVLEWIEFENFAATAFETNNFAVKRRFRFKAAQRRWEIDLLAYSEPIIVCVDCKRWRRGWGNSAITKVAAAQAQRTEAIANNLQSIQKFYKKVPVVPILQLQNFLDEFQGHITELTHFRANLGPKLPDYLNKNQ